MNVKDHHFLQCLSAEGPPLPQKKVELQHKIEAFFSKSVNVVATPPMLLRRLHQKTLKVAGFEVKLSENA